MSLPPEIESFIHDNLTLLVGVLGVLAPLLFLWVLLLNVRLSRLNRLYRKLTRGASGANLEEHLLGYVDQVTGVDARVKEVEEQTNRMVQLQGSCLQRVGLVRYDAFEDMGGEQSFSIAITDAGNNGCVISSVYSRTDVRVYAKALSNGKSTHPLSAEEQKALIAAEASNSKPVLESI